MLLGFSFTPINQCGYFSANKSKSMYQNKYTNEWISVCCSECMSMYACCLHKRPTMMCSASKYVGVLRQSTSTATSG